MPNTLTNKQPSVFKSISIDFREEQETLSFSKDFGDKTIGDAHPLEGFIGAWPGDESIEELLAELD